MATPDSQRVLDEERSLLGAETALAREEQALWQRLEGVLGSAEPSDGRAQGLYARLEALERSGAATADLYRAKEVVSAPAAAEPVPAESERTAALAARVEALRVRDVALRAFSAALDQAEIRVRRRKKELDAVESFVEGTEAAVRQYQEQQRAQAEEAASAERHAAEKAAAEQAAAQKAARDAERLAAEKAAAEKAAQAKAASEKAASEKAASEKAAAEKAASEKAAAEKAASKQTAPPAPVTGKGAGKNKSKAADKPPSVEQELPTVQVTMTADPVAAKAAPAAKATKRRAPRRRRVRLAPPPRKLDIEVAVYGENNFYTNFENKIGSGGLFVVSHETLPPGHELDLQIDLEGKKIATRGRVEFAKLDNPMSDENSPGAGLKLLNLSKDNAAAIESFFQKRAPLFYTAVQ